jgi:branched-chain amino acid aminotransferase
VDASFLHGITRDSIIKVAQDLGIEVRETHVPRESLYIADECFFCGTASEVTPVRSIDRWQIATGKRGPITGKIQERFMAIVRGDYPDRHGWLSSAVPPEQAAQGEAGDKKKSRAGAGA